MKACLTDTLRADTHIILDDSENPDQFSIDFNSLETSK